MSLKRKVFDKLIAVSCSTDYRFALSPYLTAEMDSVGADMPQKIPVTK